MMGTAVSHIGRVKYSILGGGKAALDNAAQFLNPQSSSLLDPSSPMNDDVPMWKGPCCQGLVIVPSVVFNGDLGRR